MNRLRTPRLVRLALCATLLAPASLVLASGAETSSDQPAANAPLLTLDRIYVEKEFDAESFAAKWLPAGDAYTRLEESPDASGGRDIVRYEAGSGQRSVLVPAALLKRDGDAAPLKIDDYTFSHDLALVLIYTNTQRVWRQNTRGDYWVLDRGARQLRKLGGDAAPATLMFAKISPTGRHAAYVREGNIYIEDLRDGGIKRLTEKRSDDVINGTFDWVYEEELGLRDGFRWSPDGTAIAYWQLDTSGVPRFTMLNDTDSLYPRSITFAYPKVGQQNASCRVGVVDVEQGDTSWIDLPGDPRDHYIARMDWAPGTSRIVLQQLNRLQNTNQVFLADRRGNVVQTVLTERDGAWVDVDDELYWFEGSARFTWVSERDGWRHVYVISDFGADARLATPGDFDVVELLHVDEQNESLYFVASPDNATQRFLYQARLADAKVTRLTPAAATGTHAYSISPSGRFAVHTASTIDQPPVVDLVSLPDHRTIRVLEENAKLHVAVAALRRQPTEFLRVDVGDDVTLDGWCMRPEIEPDKKYPLLVYVYGEPAGTTVVDGWGGKSQLWHQMLAQQGYVVMSFDNRGTRAPRGRAWRKSIYRQVGVIAPREQAAAVQAILRERTYLDPERVGVWGWSGGGSMSLNAVFKYPELYRTAIAVAPVPNQRYYDTIYQERYMGMPDDNVEGYVQGSAINFARQLQGNLLLVHGTGDDNCHYQTTEMLINELISHNKQFAMMAYPNRTHAIKEGDNTTRHLRELMTRYLHEHLPVTDAD